MEYKYTDGQLTTHFNLNEFRSRDNNVMLINTLTVDHIRRLEKFRMWYNRPMQIDSGYRSPAFNAAVGGVEGSQHLQGIASDIPLPLEFKDFTKERKVEFMDNLRTKWIEICSTDGLGGGFGYYDTFFHLDSRKVQSIFDYRTIPKIELKRDGLINYVEVDPLTLHYLDLSKTPKLVTTLKSTRKNFANGPFFFAGVRPIYLIVQDGVKLYDIKLFDYAKGKKGTIIIYKDGTVKIETLYTISDVSNIHLAFQGFNLNYDANGLKPVINQLEEERIKLAKEQANMNLSIIKEGYGSDVYRPCMRIGYGFNGKLVIANVDGDANTLRNAMRTLDCVYQGSTYGLGVDSGSRSAFVVNGVTISDGLALQEQVITF